MGLPVRAQDKDLNAILGKIARMTERVSVLETTGAPPLTHAGSHYTTDPLDLDLIPGSLAATKLTGIIHSDRVAGDYPSITGLGTLANLNVAGSVGATDIGANSASFSSLTADGAEIASIIMSSAGLDLQALATTAHIHMPTNAVVSPNFNADKLDGQHGPYYLDLLNHTGGATGQVLLAVTGSTAVFGQIDDSHILGAAGIAWSKLSFTGSSLADLGVRSASDLSSGNLDDARLPTGNSTWDWGPGNVLTIPREVLYQHFNTYERTSSGSSCFLIRVTGDTDYRMRFFSAGSIRFGDGTTVNGDLQAEISRSAVGRIRFSGAVQIAGNVGFYNVVPVARPAAYTQTYATASRTHAALTSAALSGIASSTTGSALAEPSAGYVQAEMQQNFRRVQDQFNLLRADLENVKQVLNSVIDDDQSQGLKQ